MADSNLEVAIIAAVISGVGVVVSYFVSKQQINIANQQILEQAKLYQQAVLAKTRDKLVVLVAILDRGLFYAGLDREDPIEMFWAIQETRTQLQLTGASYIEDKVSSEQFTIIRDELYKMEIRVEARFQDVVMLAKYHDKTRIDRHDVQNRLGSNYWAAIQAMMQIRESLREPIEKLKKRLDELNQL